MRGEDKSLERGIIEGTSPGNRKRGRSKTAWIDNVTSWTGLKLEATIGPRTAKGKSRQGCHNVLYFVPAFHIFGSGMITYRYSSCRCSSLYGGDVLQKSLMLCCFKSVVMARSGSRKNIGGGWPLIIWEATTSKTTVSNCPVLSNLCTTYVP